MISNNATLEAEREAAMKQAQSASRAAESLMDAGDAGKASDREKELEKKVKEAEAGMFFGYRLRGRVVRVYYENFRLMRFWSY